MPTPPLEEPTTKITINVFTADLEALKRSHGPGWSTIIRELLRNHAYSLRKYDRMFERDYE